MTQMCSDLESTGVKTTRLSDVRYEEKVMPGGQVWNVDCIYQQIHVSLLLRCASSNLLIKIIHTYLQVSSCEILKGRGSADCRCIARDRLIIRLGAPRRRAVINVAWGILEESG